MSAAIKGIRSFSWSARLADMADARLDEHGTDDTVGLMLGQAAVLTSLVTTSEGVSR